MRKYSRVMLGAAMAVALLASGAAASSIDIGPKAGPFVFDVDVVGATSGAVTVDQLWTSSTFTTAVNLDNSALWPNSAAGSERAIAYVSDVALNTGSTLKFDFRVNKVDGTNKAAFQADPQMFLLAWDTVLGGWRQVGALNDFQVDTAGTNFVWAQFQIDMTGFLAGTTFASTTAGSTTTPLAVDGAPLPGNAVVVISATNTAAAPGLLLTSPTIVANAGIPTGTTAALSVSEARDQASNPLTAPLTGPELILSVINGVNAAISTVTSTIDVASVPVARTKFLASGGLAPAPRTTAIDSIASYTVNNTANFGLVLDAVDTYTVAVSRADRTGVLSVRAGTTHPALAVLAGITYTATTNFGVAAGNPAGVPQDLDITVTGNDILQIGSWTVAVAANLAQTAPEPRALGVLNIPLSTTVSHTWNINGYQAVVPYFNSNATFGTQIVISNASNVPALVFFDVLSSNDTTVSGDLASRQGLQIVGKETLAPKTNGIYNAQELIDLLALPTVAPFSRNAVQITVTAPVNSVTGQAIQNDGATKRTQPLLHNYDPFDPGRGATTYKID